MTYGTWMSVMLASAGVVDEVDDVLRQKKRGVGGRAGRPAGRGVLAATGDAGGDVGVRAVAAEKNALRRVVGQ